MPPRKTSRTPHPVILVIDENEQNRVMLKFYLTREFYEVVEAVTSQEAFQKATDVAPDLILIDLNNPQLSGVLTAQRLRSIQGMSSVPIVAYAGPDSQACRDAVMASGSDAYIIKPVNPSVMMNVIKSQLFRRSTGVLPSSDVTQLVFAAK
ncbi:MAG TPA: response regulator [Pyrinomonadaceae bacterium]|nr:response regulator [Pyrinomonadaceae bacterium]